MARTVLALAAGSGLGLLALPALARLLQAMPHGIVQTMVIANGINLSSRPDLTDKYRHVYSATGVYIIMDDAIYASERIPESMSVAEAANMFCTFMLDNLKDEEEAAQGIKLQVPSWFARD